MIYRIERLVAGRHRHSANNTQVDGLDNANPTLGLTIYIPSAEVVQEVNVTTSNYNAEFGRAGGERETQFALRLLF